jgi:endonuclease/exonuclease/phosphatase family metal-dependent hydrolase
LNQLKKGFIKRADQAKSIREHIEQASIPVIVCGDFNDTPVSYTYHVIAKGMHNTFVEKGYGYSSTYSGIFPNIPIDYILVDTSFNVLSYKVIKEKQSDHFPVISNIKFK